MTGRTKDRHQGGASGAATYHVRCDTYSRLPAEPGPCHSDLGRRSFAQQIEPGTGCLGVYDAVTVISEAVRLEDESLLVNRQWSSGQWE